MEKSKLKLIQLSSNEMLTREQLKNVMGGSGGSGGPHCDGKPLCPNRIWECYEPAICTATGGYAYYCGTTSGPEGYTGPEHLCHMVN